MHSSHYRFIVVDDDERARFVIEFALRRAFPTAAFLSCADGEDALRCFNEAGADAVITDQCMPGLTGAELALAIRRRNSSVPIVMVSNSAFAREECLAAGVNCYVDKGRALHCIAEVLKELLTGNPGTIQVNAHAGNRALRGGCRKAAGHLASERESAGFSARKKKPPRLARA